MSLSDARTAAAWTAVSLDANCASLARRLGPDLELKPFHAALGSLGDAGGQGAGSWGGGEPLGGCVNLFRFLEGGQGLPSDMHCGPSPLHTS